MSDAAFLLFISAKGGAGTTTLCRELVRAMRGKNVAIVDADLTARRSVALLFDAVRNLDSARALSPVASVRMDNTTIVELAERYDAAYTLDENAVAAFVADMTGFDAIFVDAPQPFAASVRPFVAGGKRSSWCSNLRCSGSRARRRSSPTCSASECRPIASTCHQRAQRRRRRAPRRRGRGIGPKDHGRDSHFDEPQLREERRRCCSATSSCSRPRPHWVTCSRRHRPRWPTAASPAPAKATAGPLRPSPATRAAQRRRRATRNATRSSKRFNRRSCAKRISFLRARPSRTPQSSPSCAPASRASPPTTLRKASLPARPKRSRGCARKSSTKRWARSARRFAATIRTSPKSWSTGRRTSTSSARGVIERTAKRFIDERQLRLDHRAHHRAARPAHRRGAPMVDARLPDGSRVNAIIEPLSIDGADAHDPPLRSRAG